jgi:transposase-like protein
LGMTTESLRRWVGQAQVDGGESDRVTSESAREIRELKRKNAELERTIEILKAATSFFARESDPATAARRTSGRTRDGSADGTGDDTGETRP